MRVDGRPVYRYVGSLERIVRTYEAVKAGSTVNRVKRVMRTKDLRYLARMIADNLMETLKKENIGEWGSGRDLNPGPRGPQPRALPG